MIQDRIQQGKSNTLCFVSSPLTIYGTAGRSQPKQYTVYVVRLDSDERYDRSRGRGGSGESVVSSS